MADQDADSLSSDDDAEHESTEGENFSPGADVIPSNASADVDERIRERSQSQSSSDAESDAQSPLPRHQTKRRRIDSHYNDSYLELYHQTCVQETLLEAEEPYLSSQVGAMNWTDKEKARFFTALDRFGRHEVRRIASEIQTKSEFEVMAYLELLRQSHIDRQLFEKQPKNISHAEIPAAIEIGQDCEQALDQAADALSAIQEQYDVEAGTRLHGSDWLVDREVATRFDALAEEAALPKVHDETLREEDRRNHHNLFHVSTLLNLSETFFMNLPTDSAHEHWRDLVGKGQRPALTQDVLTDMFNLVVSLTQRLVQVSIYMAKSRIRATTRSDYLPSRQFTKADVTTALSILSMPADAWDFWAKLPRRHGMHVITGSHDKGASRSQAISGEQAESLLSGRLSRGRRRSMSVGSESFSDVLSEDISGQDSEKDESSDSEDISHSNDEDNSSRANSTDAKLDDGGDDSDIETSQSSEKTDDPKPVQRMSRNKRRLALEDAQDEYMERHDQQLRKQEEDGIWQMLQSSGPEPPIKTEEYHELGPRPKTLRKTEEELRGWVCVYGSEWERFGEIVPAERFGEALQMTDSKSDQPANCD